MVWSWQGKRLESLRYLFFLQGGFWHMWSPSKAGLDMIIITLPSWGALARELVIACKYLLLTSRQHLKRRPARRTRSTRQVSPRWTLDEMGASELEAVGTRWWRELGWLLKKGCPHKFTRRDGGSTGLYTGYTVTLFLLFKLLHNAWTMNSSIYADMYIDKSAAGFWLFGLLRKKWKWIDWGMGDTS